MESIFNNLITPSKRTFAVDLIAEIIASERDNQINIAKTLGKPETWIDKNIFFNVNNHEFRSAEVSEMPSIYLYFDRTDYENRQSMSKLPSKNQLIVEAFASGQNKTDNDGNIIMSADAAADYRLEYLQAQVVQIMMSEMAENIRCRAGISSTIIKSVERTYYPEKDNTTESVVSSKLVFEIEFEEKAKYLTTTEIKELYIANHIRDELVSVLIKELN